MQGFGAEIGFAVFAYRKWDLLSTTIAGALAGIGCGLYYWITNPAWSTVRASIYLGTSIISGAVLAGMVMYSPKPACLAVSNPAARRNWSDDSFVKSRIAFTVSGYGTSLMRVRLANVKCKRNERTIHGY